MKIGIIGIFLSGAIGIATAGEWSDYRKAFPLFPCSDGWSMCEVDGQTVGPGLSTDSQGNPIPANMRFSFWTLESMPSTSPFASLSEYSGDFGDGRRMKDVQEPAVAAAEEIASRVPANDVALESNSEVRVGTLHSFCYHALQAGEIADTPEMSFER